MYKLLLIALTLLMLAGCQVTEPAVAAKPSVVYGAQLCAVGSPTYGSRLPWAWSLDATLSDNRRIQLIGDSAICRDLGPIPPDAKLVHGEFSQLGKLRAAWIRIGEDSIDVTPLASSGTW